MKATSRVLIGLLLVGTVWIVSCCAILFLLGFSSPNNPIGADHDTGNLEFLASVCTLIFLLTYAWKVRRQSKAILRISLLVTIGVLSYYGYQYSIIRSEQQKVLLTYQEFRQALLELDYKKASEFMAPGWRSEDSAFDIRAGFLALGPEGSIYSVHIYGTEAEIVPSPHTSWWYREAVGDSWRFEKIDSEWYVSPENINFYMSWLTS